MANWAYVEDGKIVEKYDILPDNWRNISNFHVLKDDIEYLNSLNWTKIEHPEYSYDPLKQKLDNMRYAIDGLRVIEEWDIVDIVVEEAITIDDSIKMLTKAVQEKLDNFAQTRGYDNILSACTYSLDSNPEYQAEGLYCVKVRSETWAKFYTIAEEIRSGNRITPRYLIDIEQDLPTLNWPEKV